MGTVYLNGEFMDLAEARVPVLDRGFIFGDSIYEVIPVYSRRPFRLEGHLARLQRSLDKIRLANPHPASHWQQLIETVIEQAEWQDQGIYVQVTRGPAARDQAFPKQVTPTVFIMAMALPSPTRDNIECGVSAITAVDDRWQHCDIKTTSLLANVLLRQQSADAGCAETILIRDGFLTEGSASNIFIVTGEGILSAPAKSNLILPGVTYDVMLELAVRLGIPHVLRPIAETELRSAAEVWLTSSTKEVTAVTRLDDKPVGSGMPGPLFKQMHAAYQVYKRTIMRGQPH